MTSSLDASPPLDTSCVRYLAVFFVEGIVPELTAKEAPRLIEHWDFPPSITLFSLVPAVLPAELFSSLSKPFAVTLACGFVR